MDVEIMLLRRWGMRNEIGNALAAGKALSVLLSRFDGLDLDVRESTNFDKFERVRGKLRPDSKPSVYFDVEINSDLNERAAWYQVVKRDTGQTAALIAHRVDFIETSLRDWVTGFTVNLHLRRGETVVPRFGEPVENSRASRINGLVVYQGEMWVSPDFHGLGLGSLMNQFGVIMHYLRWSPDHSWAIISEDLIKTMFFGSGFACREPGYILDWTHGPDKPGEQREPWVSLARDEMAQFADHISREAMRAASAQSNWAAPG